MIFTKWLIIVALTFFCGVSLGDAINLEYVDGVIGRMSIRPPPNTFLLIRKKDKICAIKFTEWHRGDDKSAPNTFHSGEESFYAKYVWYLGERNVDDSVLNPPIAHGESSVTQKRLAGIGRFAFGGGNKKVSCGAFKLKWTPPANVYFFETQNRDGQYDTEIALTKWHAFEDIQLDDSLEWLRYDEKRPISIINN